MIKKTKSWLLTCARSHQSISKSCLFPQIRHIRILNHCPLELVYAYRKRGWLTLIKEHDTAEHTSHSLVRRLWDSFSLEYILVENQSVMPEFVGVLMMLTMTTKIGIKVTAFYSTFVPCNYRFNRQRSFTSYTVHFSIQDGETVTSAIVSNIWHLWIKVDWERIVTHSERRRPLCRPEFCTLLKCSVWARSTYRAIVCRDLIFCVVLDGLPYVFQALAFRLPHTTKLMIMGGHVPNADVLVACWQEDLK